MKIFRGNNSTQINGFFLIYTVWLFTFFFTACKTENQNVSISSNPIDSLTRLIELDSKNDSLYFVRAQLFVNKGILDSAKNDVIQAIQIDSLNKPNYYFLLSDLHVLQYNSKEALNVLSYAQKIFPGNIPLILKYSKLQLILKQHLPALVTLDQIYLKDPQNADAHYLAGHIFLDMQDSLKAISAFQRAVAFNPELKEAWIQLGDMYAHQKDTLALACYSNALKMDSNDVDTYHNKAFFLQSINNIDESVSLYEYIIKRFPDYEPSRYNLALLQIEKLKFEQALENLNRCALLNPQESSVFFYRAKCHEMLNKKLEAMSDYQKAAQLDSSWAEPLKALKKLQK